MTQRLRRVDERLLVRRLEEGNNRAKRALLLDLHLCAIAFAPGQNAAASMSSGVLRLESEFPS